MLNRVEVIRQAAERLHRENLQRGCDPTQPYSFARREAEQRGIAVERLPTDDIRLRGAQALYDPDALLILHESANQFSDAFLVAHELGHITCGVSGEENSLEVAVLVMAAQTCSSSTTAQMVHLSDQQVHDVDLTPKKLRNRKDKLDTIGASIRAGDYPPSPSVTCPRCPAYFVCGPLPTGRLQKKISG